MPARSATKRSATVPTRRLLDGFSYVITYLDRFDSVSNLISQLAFMENVRVTEEMLSGLLEHRAAFDNLREGCFVELFIRELFGNAYLGRFGRRKVKTLLDGLDCHRKPDRFHRSS